jgi:hypothetical protein
MCGSVNQEESAKERIRPSFVFLLVLKEYRKKAKQVAVKN